MEYKLIYNLNIYIMNNSCLYCNCSNEEPWREVFQGDEYKGFLCLCCNSKVKYCHSCSKFHELNEFISNSCVYQSKFYKNLINALKTAEILPSNYI